MKKKTVNPNKRFTIFDINMKMYLLCKNEHSSNKRLENIFVDKKVTIINKRLTAFEVNMKKHLLN